MPKPYLFAMLLLATAAAATVPPVGAAVPYEFVRVTLPSPVDGAAIDMGIYFPPTPGCEYALLRGKEGTGPVDPACRLPVVLIASPYFAELEGPVTNPTALGRDLLEDILPHGYAIALLSARGTGESGGCVDFLGPNEQSDLDHAVTFLGRAPWSTGKVAMIGVSYDGSTPWEAAATGNPHLATIVPIAGITSLPELFFRNGSAEYRAPFLGATYWAYGVTTGWPPLPEEPSAQWPERLCPDLAAHVAWGSAGAAHGSSGLPVEAARAYWEARDFRADVLANYSGSVFFIHGFEDYNVDASMVFPFYQDLEAKGTRLKALFGNWHHYYPPAPTQAGWLDLVRRWFDQELKGLEADLGPDVLVRHAAFEWYAEETYPPPDAAWRAFHPDVNGALVSEGATGRVLLAQGTPPLGVRCDVRPSDVAPFCDKRDVHFDSAYFDRSARIAGQAQFHVRLTPGAPGGFLAAHLEAVDLHGCVRTLGHAFMDLRYAAGGGDPQPVVPGRPLVARMEFLPFDAKLEADDRLRLRLDQSAWPWEPDGEFPLDSPVDRLGVPAPIVLELDADASVLRVPFVDRLEPWTPPA